MECRCQGKTTQVVSYGHLLRLPVETPARQALFEAEIPVKKAKGGQKLTWLKLIEKDLKNITITVTNERGVSTNQKLTEIQVFNLANDRTKWRNMVRRACQLTEAFQ